MIESLATQEIKTQELFSVLIVNAFLDNVSTEDSLKASVFLPDGFLQHCLDNCNPLEVICLTHEERGKAFAKIAADHYSEEIKNSPQKDTDLFFAARKWIGSRTIEAICLFWDGQGIASEPKIA